MELAKIRSLSDEELAHQQKTSAEQLFRLRFQVSMGQNDGVKKIRLLRKEIAQIKTVAREREIGIHGEGKDATSAAPLVEAKAEKVAEAALVEKAKKPKAKKAAATADAETTKTKKAAPAAEKKTAKGARK
jgi:large subunit ribosomal protein L29